MMHNTHMQRTYQRMGDIALTQAMTVKTLLKDVHSREQHKVFGQLVRLGFDVTVFTPASYLRRSLRRPSMEL